jgi:hypothetical protein
VEAPDTLEQSEQPHIAKAYNHFLNSSYYSPFTSQHINELEWIFFMLATPRIMH